MAVNMAQKRGKKAQRRKQLAALAKREDAVQNSLPARVVRASQAPLRHCCIHERVFEMGVATLVVARGITDHDLNVAVFLLDTYSRGVKDVVFAPMEREMLDRYLAKTGLDSPMIEIDPAEARKLLRDLVAWSKTRGIAPHRDFAAVEQIFGDADADASDAVFQFGALGLMDDLDDDPDDSDDDTDDEDEHETP